MSPAWSRWTSSALSATFLSVKVLGHAGHRSTTFPITHLRLPALPGVREGEVRQPLPPAGTAHTLHWWQDATLIFFPTRVSVLLCLTPPGVENKSGRETLTQRERERENFKQLMFRWDMKRQIKQQTSVLQCVCCFCFFRWICSDIRIDKSLMLEN